MTGRETRSAVWLVDGYNVIFNTPFLDAMSELQESREALRDRCVQFALRHDIHIVLVFDGSSTVSLPASRRHGPLEIVFAAEGGRADDRIVLRAQRLAEEGKNPVVVTEDRELVERLPPRTRVFSIADLWRTFSTGAARAERKPTRTDPDIAEHFLAREPLGEQRESRPPRRVRDPGLEHRRARAVGERPDGNTPREAEPRTPTRRAPRAAGEPSHRTEPDPRERLRLKKERGRRKQLRRLALRKKRSRRP